MAELVHSADVTRADFDTLVLARSRQLPVLVDFWAAWCGPCRMLMPVLAKLADEYGGKFFLAKVDTDAERDLAARYGIRSLPTVKLFRNGEVVDEFMGVQPESAIRALIDRHVPRPADAIIEQALALQSQSKADDAIELLRRVLAEDPGYARTKVELARLLFSVRPDDGGTRLDEGEQLLKSLSPDRRAAADVTALLARLQFLRIVATAPPLGELERKVSTDPANSAARYQLSAYKALANDYEPALQHLLEIVRRDRRFEDDGARRAMLGLFDLLGSANPLVARYRGLLSSALH